jgi:hypothetical protein
MPYSGNPTVRSFKADMLTVQEQMAREMEKRYLAMADELVKNMQGAVAVLKGTLRASIRKKNVTRHYQSSKKVSVLVLAGGPTTTHHTAAGVYDYALGTEFGTVKEKPEPFFYSSARLYAQAGREGARETMDQVIEENNRVRALRSQNYSNGGATVSVGGRGGATVIRGKI